jgi:hypothetical protein
VLILTAPAASADLVWQWGKNEVVPACNLLVYIEEDGVPSLSIFNMVLDNSSSEQSFTASSADPGFSDFVSHLTNGVNGSLVFSLKSTATGAQVGGAFTETEAFGIIPQGAQINGISLTINQFTLDSPGTDPNHNGLWTDGSCDFTMGVVPEPNSLFLLAIGLIVIVAFGRKKKVLC